MVASLGGPRRIILNPELYSAKGMVRLSESVTSGGVDHLHLFFHSSSLKPGLTPFTPMSRDVDRLFDRLERLLELLQCSRRLSFATVIEAADMHEACSAVRSSARGVQASDLRAEGEVRQPSERRRNWLSFGYYGEGRALMGYVGRYCYWMLGGYRKYGRVGWSDVKRLVFVCRGNICRSAYAESFARARGLAAVSIGIDAMSGRPADATAIRIAKERNISLVGHRTTPLEDLDVEEGDLFVAMEPSQVARLEAQHWKSSSQITLLGLWVGLHGPVILDPYEKDDSHFAGCFSFIEEGIRAMERQMGVSGPTENGGNQVGVPD